MNYRVRFDGVYLDEVTNVDIEDIRVSPIQLNPISQSRQGLWGSQFVRMDGGTRTVTITFAVLDDDLSNRLAKIRQINEWAKSDKEYNLTLPQLYSNAHLQCVCTQKPEPSSRQWWESKLRIVFTCYDNPYWTSNSEITIPCGQEFSVGGNAPPLMTITRQLTAVSKNQTYSNGTQTMTFSEIPNGKLTIDLNSQTAKVGSKTIMSNLSITSDFISPQLGNQTITGNGFVNYRERWE